MCYIKKMRKIIGKVPLFSPGASIIVYENDKYLLQLRKDFNIWGLHGGSMELGETGKEVAFRELKEETGLDALKMDFFQTYAGKDFKIIYPNGDIIYAIVMAYVVTKTKGQLNKKNQEIYDLKWFNEKDLPIENMMQIDKIFLTDFLKFKNMMKKEF